MQDKAAEPDGWEAKDLIRLPQPWWDALAMIWNRVLQEGNVPQRWAEATELQSSQKEPRGPVL